MSHKFPMSSMESEGKKGGRGFFLSFIKSDFQILSIYLLQVMNKATDVFLQGRANSSDR